MRVVLVDMPEGRFSAFVPVKALNGASVNRTVRDEQGNQLVFDTEAEALCGEIIFESGDLAVAKNTFDID